MCKRCGKRGMYICQLNVVLLESQTFLGLDSSQKIEAEMPFRLCENCIKFYENQNSR